LWAKYRMPGCGMVVPVEFGIGNNIGVVLRLTSC